ncbi:MAG: hypothetical protein LLG37_02270 [Spirochaetia bacterium]|nr:hypothetical protein [Spirochaetia bacterium]
MKKLLMALIIMTASVLQLYIATLRNFEVNIGATSMTAGEAKALDIVARDIDGAIKTDFNGTVRLSATVGYVSVTATGTAGVVDNFTGGVWHGDMSILGAGSVVTLTATDDATGTTGTTAVEVLAGPYSKLLMIMEGMTWAPGTDTGYTGYAVTQTTGITSTFYVTAYACDAYYNTVTAGYPRVRITSSIPAAYMSITPSSTVDLSADMKANTLFAVSVYPVPDASIFATLSLADVDTPPLKHDQTLFFASLTDYFIWAEAPLTVRAGSPFSVTVKVSHFVPPSMGGSGATIIGFNEPVEIRAVDNVTRLDANPGLLPAATPQLVTLNGAATFNNLIYWKRALDINHAIRIRPAGIGATAMSNANNNSRDSNYIEVFSAEPDSFSTSVAKSKIAKNEQTTLSVTVFDAYYNPVSDTAVTFNITSGEGSIDAGTATKTVTVNTDFYGTASVPYSYSSNAKACITAASAGIPGFMTMTVETGTILSKDLISNYPNPFNPSSPDPGKRKTTFEYYLENDTAVKLSLYSISGSLVWSKDFAPGSIGGRTGDNPVEWNGVTNLNTVVAAGVYILKVEVDAAGGKYSRTRKIAVKK